MPTEIKQVITKIAPKTLFPIHTEHPELYSKFVSDITNVQVPKKQKLYQKTPSDEWN